MKKTFATAIVLLLLASCATGPSPEPTPAERMNEIWVRNRELYYRNAGWNGADATFQAEQDLQAGKSVPTDRPPMERRPRG